jgi:hypothetical protein
MASPTPGPKNVSLPSAIHEANSVDVCGKHISLDAQVSACGAAVAAKKMVVTWSFHPNDCAAGSGHCESKIKGFTIYKSGTGPTGTYDFVASQTVDPTQTAIVLSELRADDVGSCFRVSAFTDTIKGDMSVDHWCIDALAVAPTPTPAPTTPPDATILASSAGYTNTATEYAGPSTGFCMEDANTKTIPSPKGNAEALVGYVDRGAPNACLAQARYEYIGAFFFDVSHLKSTNVLKATLRMPVATALVDANSSTQQVTTMSCATAISYAMSRAWMKSPISTNYQGKQFAVAQQQYNSLTADVTVAVKSWLNGTPNDGLIFDDIANSPTWNQDDLECLTEYRNPEIDITFAK